MGSDMAVDCPPSAALRNRVASARFRVPKFGDGGPSRTGPFCGTVVSPRMFQAKFPLSIRRNAFSSSAGSLRKSGSSPAFACVLRKGDLAS